MIRRPRVGAAARLFVLLLACCAIARAPAQAPAPADRASTRAPASAQILEPGRFEVLDVYLDTAEPLAAWQFELTERSDRMQVVGIEGGEAAAFTEAPYYDRNAVARGAADKIIVASFSLEAPPDLPTGRTRVASVHVRLTGNGAPDYDLRLVAAGAADGATIPAKISLVPRTGR